MVVAQLMKELHHFLMALGFNVTDFGTLTILGMTVLQITPIQINPWTTFAKWIGKIINQETRTELAKQASAISNLTVEVCKLSEKVDESEAKAARARILSFGDEIIHGVRHSKDLFEQAIIDIDCYNEYCDNHPNFRNSLTLVAQETIIKAYEKAYQENDFEGGK